MLRPVLGREKKKSNRASFCMQETDDLLFISARLPTPHSNFPCQSQLSCTAYTAIEPERRKSGERVRRRVCGSRAVPWRNKTRQNRTLILRQFRARAEKLSLIATVTEKVKIPWALELKAFGEDFFEKSIIFFLHFYFFLLVIFHLFSQTSFRREH